MNLLKKPIILHFHIYKNAGSTVEWILEKNFPKKTLSIDSEKSDGILSFDKIIETLEKNQNIKSVSSHQIRFPIPTNIEFQFIPILFIRHPVDRAFSIYFFKKKEIDNSIGSIKARSLSLSEFIKWNLDFKGRMSMKNFQTLFLSNKNTNEKVDEKDLKLAINRIKNCVILGIVDRMDESLLVAEENLRPYFENIDFSYVKQNVSKERKKILQDRLFDEQTIIGPDLTNALYEENKLDMILYLEANKELDRRIIQIENFQHKLKIFSMRAKTL